ncbi:MAG TPA: FtsX-like permease family protein [Streptosporangiaceae bacterium]|nr:FtsX-like permease family protein [Streptosporangiaceae bacterium]
MGSVTLSFLAGLRHRWRGPLVLALLLGLISGAALTAAAGARRTATAYPRLLRWSSAPTVQVIPDCTGLAGFYRALAQLPQVAALSTEVVYELATPGRGGVLAGRLEALASPDGTLGVTTNRVRILAGRWPARSDPAGVVVDPQLAAQQRLQPGSTVHLIGVPSTAKVCPPQPVRARPGHPVPLAFRVSAVAVFDDQVVPAPGLAGAPRVLLSPAFWRGRTGRPFGPGDAANVRLRPGASPAAFRAAATALARHYRSAGGLSFVNLTVQQAATERAIGPAATALALFAALAGLLALAVLGPLLARQLILDAAEFRTLRTLGMTPRLLFWLSLARAAAVTTGGALLGVILAIVASPVMPVGAARLAEPDPGVQADFAVLAVGLAVTVLAPVALMVPVAWRLASSPGGPPGVAEPGGPPRRSPIAAVLGRTGLVTSTLGARMAFEPGQGRSAVPVRSALAAATVAVGAVVAAAVFGASLITLISTPHRYGQNWTEELDLQFAGVPAALLGKVMAQPGVRGYAAGDYGQLGIGGQAVPAVGVDPLHGRDFLTLLAGHAPDGPGQLVLGERTLRAAGWHIGQVVPVQVNGTTRRLRITGVATFPLFSQATAVPTDLGTGAAVSARLLSVPNPPLCGGSATCYNFALIRYRPGTSRPAATARLAATVARAGCQPGLCLLVSDQRPADIRDYTAVRDTPLALGVLLALLAVGALAHVLVTSVRRRHRDLAILKTLGLFRGQLRLVIAWQATALAAVALLIGLPAGLLAGRWAWALFAASLGVGSAAVIPVLVVLLAIPVTWLLALLTAVLPAREAAHVSPATQLRAE